MSTPIGIWSLVVPPQTADMFFTPEADVCITSAALGGEELVGNKRALLSLTHVSLDDGSEDEFDSDDEEDSDEDDDEDEDEEMEPVSTASKKSSASAKSSASKKSSKSEDDEEDEDEDDEDDEEDDEPALQTVTLAALTPGKIEHVSVNVTVNARTTVMFTNNSENEIHLIGNYVLNGHDHDDEDDFSDEDVDDSEEEGSDLEDLINDDESDEDAVPAGHIEEVEMAGKLGAHIGKAEKRKALEDALAQETQAAKADLAPAPDSTMSKKAKKALKKQRTESGEAVVTSEAADSAKSSNGAKKAAAAAAAPVKGQAVKKQTLPSGIIVEDMTIGTGPIAKNGNNIKMRYIGKLTSGKVFDKNVSGPPFKFKLGTGEVIKGWDLGIAGMQVGGERKLTIPAELAYGKQSVGGIPKNSTLVFEVKMLGC